MAHLTPIRRATASARPLGMARDLGVRGGVVSIHRPPVVRPRRAAWWQPIPRGVRGWAYLRSVWLEALLHLRLAWAGLWRGLLQAQGVLAASRLYVTIYRHDGRVEPLGLVATKVITDAGVSYLADDFSGAANDVSNFNFHGAGSGSVAEAASDTALGAEFTTQLNPDNTRATGTRSKPAANQYRTVGTLTFDANVTVREHGLFSQATTGAGTLWDRSVHGDQVLVSGDSIQYTYTLTISSGG